MTAIMDGERWDFLGHGASLESVDAAMRVIGNRR